MLNQNPVDGFLTIVADGVQHTVLASNPMFANAVSAFQSKNWDALMLAIDPSLKFKNLYAKYEQIEVKDMERDDWEDAEELVEVTVPTELVKRVVEAISNVMIEWEDEQRAIGVEFNALIGTSAVHMAMQFIDRCMERLPNETMQ